MSATICQSCQASLLPIKTSAQQLVRCGQCGHTFLPDLLDEAAIQKTDRMAKWSFILGLSSVILCMFTGIPALILGIRSLRRMRFRVVKQKEKFQAVTGTVMGLLFGVVGGTCLTFTGIMGGILFATLERSEDADRVAEMTAEIVEFDNNLGLFPSRAVSILQQKFIQYSSDKDEQHKGDTRMFILQVHMQPNDAQVRAQLSDRFVGDKDEYDRVSLEKLEWDLVGETKGFREIFENKEDPTQRVIRYTSITKVESTWFGLALASRQTDSGPTEQEIRAFFESIRPKCVQIE